jgi:hypothetical protein
MDLFRKKIPLDIDFDIHKHYEYVCTSNLQGLIF